MPFRRIRAPEKPTVCMVRIYEDDVERIAEETSRWPDRETGGELYGYWDNRGVAIGHVVTGPGPNAVHERAHFAQDVEFLVSTHAALNERHGLDLIGRWHSHHRLGLERPSGGDEKSLASLMTRNRIQHMVEIIVTVDDSSCSCPGSSGDSPHVLRLSAKQECEDQHDRSGSGVPAFKLNAYLYSAGKLSYVPCAIALLSGASPLHTSLIPGTTELDERGAMDGRSDSSVGIPSRLFEERQALPPGIRERCEIRRKGDTLFLKIPAARRQSLTVVYRIEQCAVPVAACIANEQGTLRGVPKQLMSTFSMIDVLNLVEVFQSTIDSRGVNHGDYRPNPEPVEWQKNEEPGISTAVSGDGDVL